MSDDLIWVCFEPINYPVPRILHGHSDPNGDKDVYVPYVPADRIEQLERELSDGSFYKETTIDAIIQGKEVAEAKLAKAVNVLNYIKTAFGVYSQNSREGEIYYKVHTLLKKLESKE